MNKAFSALLAATSCMVVMATPAIAQENGFAIAAGGLKPVLDLFSKQSGRAVIYRSDEIAGARSPGFKGAATPEVALKAILSGTGFSARHDQSGAIAIVREQPIVDTAIEATGNEITVTSQRSEQRLRDVPISVSVTTGAQAERSGTRTLEDLASRLPNVRIAQVPGGDAINIRGVGSGINLGFEQSVPTFVDGAYRGRARASRLGFFDVERIELLRGPQTTYFGNNAIAGAINITTRKPDHDWDYNASGLYAPTDGEYSFEAGVTAPVTETLAIRASGRASGMGGYIHNRADDSDGPNTDERIGRISARWDPSNAVRVDARVEHGRVRGTGIYNSELLFCPGDAAFGTPRGACARTLAANGGEVDDQLDHSTYTGPSRLAYDYTEASIQARIELGAHRLTTISTYFQHDYDQLTNVVPTTNGSVVSGSAFGLSTRSKEKLKQFSQEVRFESADDRPISYMMGAYYLHGDLDAAQRSGYWFAANFASYVDNSQTDDLFSVFGASTIRFSSRLRLNLGLRWSLVDKHADRSATGGTADYYLTDAGLTVGNLGLLDTFGVSTAPYASASRSDNALMPSVNIQYDVTRNASAYASYTRGFKAGGYAMGATSSMFAPETVDAFEIGLKSSLWDNRVTLNLAAFHSVYHDLQEATFVILENGTPQSSIGNAAASTVKGVEFSGSIKPLRGLMLSVDGAYLSSKYDSYPLGPCTALGSFLSTTCVQNLSGVTRAFSPKWSGNIAAQYIAEIGDYRLRFDTSLFLTSRYFEQANGDPLSLQKGYGKVDARIGFGPSSEKWEAAIIGKNLNDATTASFRSAVPSSPGSYQALTDRPRSIALQFTIRR